MAAVIIAIGVVVILAGVFVLTTARRDRAEATGYLSRETKKRDRSRDNPLIQEVEQTEGAPVTGRAVERAAVLERRGETAVVVAPRPSPPAPMGPIDEEAYGVTRRQFFN